MILIYLVMVVTIHLMPAVKVLIKSFKTFKIFTA